MTRLVLKRAWGWDRARLPPELDTAVLTDDPTFAYVLGNVGTSGALRTIDLRSGLAVREASMPLFLRASGRAVVSRAAPDRTVVAAIENEGRATLLEVNLIAGNYRWLADLPWQPRSVERVARDARLLIDEGVVLDLNEPAEPPDALRRWRSPDLRYMIL